MMDFRILPHFKRFATVAAVAAVLVAPGLAHAQWYEDDTLFDDDYYGEGYYEGEVFGDDDWYYDEYGENYELYENELYDYDYGYDYAYNDYGDYYEEDEEWFDWW